MPTRPDRANWGQQGQSLVLVALLLVALIGLLALVLDGGHAYLERRLAQNAADAGALAGAREWCMSGSASDATARALEYAVDQNGAQEAAATAEAGEVTVETSITFQTWFGTLLGQPEITAAASAAAGCFVPTSGTGVLPVAWSCQAPVGGSASPDCLIRYGPGQIYIIMNTDPTSVDVSCAPAGPLDCDYNNDGFNDILASGNRSWLDLNGGGGGASELSNFLLGGYGGTINIHTWYSGITGADASVFKNAKTRVGHDVVLPVFDKFCSQKGLPQATCPGMWDSGDITVAGSGTNDIYFHVISFAYFHITCVSEKPPAKCPGKDAAIKDGSLKNNDLTIEGYFQEGIPPGLTGGPGGTGKDAGAYTLYLTR